MIDDLLKYKSIDNGDSIYMNINNFMDIVYQNNLHEYIDNIYDDNDIKNEILQSLENSGWERVKFMLEDINMINFDYFIKDGYGNFRNITNKDINSIIDDMVTNLKKSKEDYEL